MTTLPFRIVQTMTTPSRPGRFPRPVWTTQGPTEGFEEAIRAAGGQRYRGAWSFWADPSEQLASVTRTTFAERQEAERERAADRAERYANRAERAEARAGAAWERAKEITDRWPMGQPILVGHHSERRHRRDIERSDRAMSTLVAEHAKAEHYQHRAAVAERKATGEHSLGYCLRRRDEAATNVRTCERILAGETRAYGPLTEDFRRQTEARLADQRDRLAYWTGEIERLQQSGLEVLGPHNVRKGDQIKHPWGIGTVIRANPKSVTVTIDKHLHWSGEMKVGYDRIGRITDEDDA